MHNLHRTSPVRRSPILVLLSANAVSMTGNALADVAIPWFVLQTTGSAAKMGIVFGVTGAAKVAAAALTGPIVDRLGLKRTSVATDLANVVIVALIPTLHWTVGLPFGVLLVLVVVGSVVDMPGFSARLSLLPALADIARMPKERANSGYQAIQGLSGMAGPPLAGALVAAFGAPLVVLLNSLTFAVSAALVAAAVPPHWPAPGDGSAGNGYLGQLKEGLAFMRRARTVLSTVALVAALAFAYFPLTGVVFAVYARETFGSAAGFGLMLGGFAGGTLVGSVLFGAVGHHLRRKVSFTVACLGTALLILALLAVPPLLVAVGALFVAGVLNSPVNPVMFAVIQERTPESLLGRVNSAMVAVTGSAAPLGYLLVGYLVEAAGAHSGVGACAVVYLLVALTSVLNPAMKEIDARDVR